MCNETDLIPSGNMNVLSQKIVKNFSLEAFRAFGTYVPSGSYILNKCC
jgi:hypothetical protein